MSCLILLRHGESIWNKENRFTGWTDIDLTPRGIEEARKAGKLLRGEGYLPDVAFTSVLKRAIRTLWFALEEADRAWIPVHRSWRLNERHYGALQGRNKAEAVQRHGAEKVMLWRRSYQVRPPALTSDDRRHPGFDPRYRDLEPAQIPLTECLEDTVERLLPYWHEAIAPILRVGKCALVVAHGNSLRALVKHLDGISDQEIVGLNIPTGIPRVYELGDNLRPDRAFYLGDPEEVARATHAVSQEPRTTT